MSGATIVPCDEGGFRVEGVLDFDSVAALVGEGARLLAGPGPLDVDLSGVRESNSAALALLLEWLALARRRKLKLRFHHLPDSLARLAAVSNVSGLLGLAGAGA
jgi:phospholipid transport system transporter-binding protein